jgi:phenylalanyl-tRNA synthetase alpha chain
MNSPSLPQSLQEIRDEALAALSVAANAEAMEELRVRYLGRKSRLTELVRSIGAQPAAARPELGKLGNRIKREIESEFEKASAALRDRARAEQTRASRVDVTLPGVLREIGHLHPVTSVLNEIIAVFQGMGFSLETGPEAETEYFNFDALNIPPDHPARDMWDTLYLAPGVCLRTHTSPVQIRTMEKQKPPVRMICAGKTFRADTPDASHSPMFHQLEGLLVDRRVSLSDLKGVLGVFVRRFFGEKTRLRFRPSFFPFTEPSAEVDISCLVCGGSGCPVCSKRGWLEILGAGMVNPAVFEAVGYDPKKFTGFAFGMGIERIAILRYGIEDIRLFFENDLRFLKQF